MNDLPRPDETPRREALNEWNRDREARKIAGVCAGLADALGISVTAVRAGFVLLALPPFSGIGILLYLSLWFVMPVEDEVSGLDRLVRMVSRLASDPPRRARARAERAPIETDDGY